MHRRDVRLSPWSVDIDRDPIRIPLRPLTLRHDDFEDRYDFTTVFFDCFWDATGEAIILVGPPLLNLERDLDVSFVASPSMARCDHATRHTYLGCQIKLVPPPGTTGLIIRSSIGESFIAPQPSLCELFRDRRAIFTLSQNNELLWIRDWIHFNREYHGCNAVLIYDNKSSKYGINEIYEYLQPVTRDIPIVVLSWPFAYGVFDGRVPVSYELWDSQYCQTGAWEHARRRFLALARSVLNSDIDELVVTDDRSSLFDLVEGSATGFIAFEGTWVENYPQLRKGRGRRPPRHKDFACVSTGPQVGCEAKWAVVPSRVPDAAQWEIHHVLGMPLSETRQVVQIRHFKAINTNWDVDHKRTGARRTAMAGVDPRSLRHDAELQETLAAIFRNVPDEPARSEVTGAAPAYAWRIRSARLAAERKWRPAFEAMRTALALMPDHAGFRLFAAKLLDRTKNEAEGRRERTRAEELRHGDPWFHFQHGRWLEDTGDLAAAEASFASAIEREPGMIPAYHELARIRDHYGQGSKAEEKLEACARLLPNDAATQALLAQRFVGGGLARDALAHAEAAIALDASNPHHHWLLARALRAAGRLDEAEAAVRQGLELDDLESRMQALGLESASLGALAFYFRFAPTDYRGAAMAPALLAERAEILLEKSDPIAAAEVVRDALALSRTNPERYALLSRVLARSGDHKGAQEAVETAIQLARQEVHRPTLNTMPLLSRTKYWESRTERLASVLAATGRADEAVSVLREALEVLPTNAPLNDRLAMLLVESGHSEEAATMLRSAIEQAPDNPRLRHSLSKVLEKSALPEAIAAVEAAVGIEPRQRYYQDQLVALLMAAGRYQEAEAALERALALGLQHGPLFYRRSHLLRRRGRSEEALAAARTAVELDPRREYLRDHLVELLLEAGHIGEAETTLRAGLQLAPEGGRLHYRLSGILQRGGLTGEALATARRAVELEPQAAYLRENHAALLLDAGRFQEAETALGEAIGLAPGQAGLHYQLSRLLQHMGRPGEALSSARRAVEIEAGQRYFQDHLVALLIAADRHDEAEAALEKALALGLRHGPLFYRRSQILRRQQRLEEAIAAAASAAELEPRAAYLRENHVALLLDAGRFQEAETVLGEAVALAPRQAGLHFHLSRLMQQLQHPDEALAAARRAVELEPGQAYLHSFLAWRLGDAGRHREAIDALARAIELAPHVADYHFWLSQFLRQQHRLDEAVRAAGRSIELDDRRADLKDHLASLLAEAAQRRGDASPAGERPRGAAAE